MRAAPSPSTHPATVPPSGLPGLDAAWSHLVAVRHVDGDRTWHVLDTGPLLAERGVTPVGTILAVHGNPTWSYLWRHVVRASLARPADRTWRVIAVDQLEMGFSERSGLDRDLPTRVADLGALTDTLGITGPVVTLGHDWGGVVSLGWAVDHRDVLVASAVLNTAVHQPHDQPIPAPLRLALRPGVLTASTVTTTGFLDTTLALARPALDPHVRAAYRAPYRGADRRRGIGGFVADIPVDAGHPSHPELVRIAEGLRTLDVPALALWGPEDPVFRDRYLADLVDRLPRLDAHRFEGAGHLVAEDVDVAEHLFTWLDDQAFAAGLALHESVPSGEPGQQDRATPSTAPDAPRRPLWAALDERPDDAGAALVELDEAGAARTVSWRLLARRVDQLARGLVSEGVRPGDRVALLVTPGADLTAALYACLRIGVVVVVADAGLGPAGLGRAQRGTQPRFLIGVDRALVAARALGWPGRRISARTLDPLTARALGVVASLPQLARRGADVALPPEPTADDVAAVLFTSGSTGPAKGVTYTHGRLEALRDRIADQVGVGRGTGLVAGFAPFALLGPALGATSVTPAIDVTKPATLTAALLADAVDAVGATVVFASPAALANVVATADALEPDRRAALTTVSTLLSAGAPVSPELLGATRELLPNATPHAPYGMTEALLVTDVSFDDLVAATAAEGHGAGVCVGLPASGVEVTIAPLDADGHATGERTTEHGVTGEVVIAAPHVMLRYDRLWRTQRESARDSADGVRRHRTGDVGHFDAAGRLWIEGRLPHVVVTADGVVTPVGVERLAEQVLGVRRAAAVGVGPRGTAQLVVVVEVAGASIGLADAGTAAAVRELVPHPVAAVVQVPELPTDIRHRSKIDRTALAAWATRLLAGDRVGAP